MLDRLGGLKRTHTCGALSLADQGKTVVLMGWVASRRDHGGLIFVDLRDRYGLTQVVFNPQRNAAAHDKARRLRREFVLAVRGRVERRPEGTINPNLTTTGTIEVNGTDLWILNESKPLPFAIEDELGVSEELRLTYRYLDLRRPLMQRNLFLRHRAYQATRAYLNEQGFLEVETPLLMKSTPEGARDFLVPSRIQPGKFYALPQSPQIYKQILMVAGLDKYYQIAKCFRDEDLRADRQPEFTQIDIEMSFAEVDDVLALASGLTLHLFQEVLDVTIDPDIPCLTYDEALDRYGTEKPDLRFGMELVELSDLFRESRFPNARQMLDQGGVVKGIRVPGQAGFSRRQLDELDQFTIPYQDCRVVYMKVTEHGVASPLAKFFAAPVLDRLLSTMGAEAGDLLLFSAHQAAIVQEALGELRLKLARQLDLISEAEFRLVWVVDFPLLEYNPDLQRYEAMHHPFTAPKDDDLGRLESAPDQVRAKAYDLVLNGNEIAGGSIRIHRRDIQNRLFRLLNISEQEAQEKFGFLLDAFEFGAPPHGGIAYGFDRLLMVMAGQDSIRQVIAFPKTSSGTSLMDSAPGPITPEQLRELGLALQEERAPLPGKI